MKTSVKKISILAVLAFAVLSVLSILPTGVVTKVNAEETAEEERVWTLQDTQNVASFIQNNLETFVQKYNESREDESEYLHATGVERIKIVNLIEDENYGAYIDFDGNNGYAVVTGDYTIYDLQTEGDLSYLDDEEEVYYSYFDGFYRLGDDGLFERHEGYLPETAPDDVVSTTPSGVDEEGYIIDLEDYIESHYEDYTYNASALSGYVPNYIFQTQNETSYFLFNPADAQGNRYNFLNISEGNCALTAMSNILKFWGQEGLAFTYHNETIDLTDSIENNPYYADFSGDTLRPNYAFNPEKEISDKNSVNAIWHVNGDLTAIPFTYSVIYNHCLYHYGYTPESGFNVSNVPAVLEYYVTLYNESLSIDVVQTTDTVSVRNSMHQGRAVYMALSKDPVYENHGVAIIDIDEYKYEDGWWIFAETKYAYFYEIIDGHNGREFSDSGELEDNGIRYYDPNANNGASISYCVWI